MKTKENILIIISLLLLIISFIVPLQRYDFQLNKINEKYILDKCSNKDLKKTSYCLKNIVDKVYYYNNSKIEDREFIIKENIAGDVYKIFEPDNNLNIYNLIHEGGVCWDYANFYYKYLEIFGFNARIDGVSTKENEGHAYTVVSNDKYFCILDQLNVDCFEFK
jgi:hypothetical protein